MWLGKNLLQETKKFCQGNLSPPPWVAGGVECNIVCSTLAYDIIIIISQVVVLIFFKQTYLKGSPPMECPQQKWRRGHETQAWMLQRFIMVDPLGPCRSLLTGGIHTGL